MSSTATQSDRTARASSRTYEAARVVSTLALRIFYRRIATVQGQHLPSGGPVVIAANHPNYIIDALALGTRTHRQLHFVAKGALLDRYPVVSRFLRAAGVLPVFRQGERPAAGGAVARASANLESFGRCADLLEENGVICMFAEGQSHPERQVREVRTGTARIVLEAEARHDYRLGVQVVPAGLYFPDVDRFFSDGAVAFGPPIDTAPYLAQHATDSQAAVRAFTAEIQLRLRDLALHVPDPAWAACVEQVADFAGGWPESTPDAATRLRLTREVSAALQAFQAADPAAAARFRRSTDLLWMAADAWQRHGGDRSQVPTRLQDAATLPLASFGFLFNMPPYLLLRLWIALFVHSREKRAFLKVVLGAPLFLGWYSLAARYMARRRLLGPPGLMPVVLAVAGPVMGFVGLRMRVHRRRWLDAWRPRSSGADAAREAEISLERTALLTTIAPWLPAAANGVRASGLNARGAEIRGDAAE